MRQVVWQANSFFGIFNHPPYSRNHARRQPGEVLATIDAGMAAGALNASMTPVTEAKALATARVASDKASLAGLYRDAHAANANAAAVVGTADDFLGYGDAAKAAELYKIALTRPGVDTGRALTRLGIAQLDSGDTAGALDSFGKVTGPRQALAQFWTAYANSKTAAPK